MTTPANTTGRGWQTTHPRPVVTYGLLAVNVVVYLVCAGQAGSLDVGRYLPPLFDRWALVGTDIAAHEYWRLLTAGFLHVSAIHVAVNMFSLYVLGRSLEPALGSARFAMIYLTALFGGSAAVVLFGSATVMTAGASGAIYGLMGALLILVLRTRMSVAPVVGIIAINIVLSVTLPGISILAHLGGLAFGVLATAAFVYLPDVVARERPTGTQRPSAAAGRGAWAAAVALLLVAVALGVFGGR